MVIRAGIYFSEYRITAEALLKEPGFNETQGLPLIQELLIRVILHDLRNKI
jgi:hypothetical protein